MHNSGLTKIDIDSVLGVLLGGAGVGPSTTRRGDDRRSRSVGRIRGLNNSREQQQTSNHRSATKGRINNQRTTLADDKEQVEQFADEVLGSIEIIPGKFAKLLKGQQTWNAMHNGTAVSVGCIVCDVTLQCCPEADYVLCPDCNVVSPMPSKGTERRGPSARCLMKNETKTSNRRLSMGSHFGAVGLGYRKE